MAKHLIVGATGGLGWAIAKTLSEKGEQVVAFAKNKAKAEVVLSEFSNIEIIQGNAGKLEDVENALQGCSSLFYCINIPYSEWEEKSRKFLSVSLEATVKHNAKFIFPGNVYVFGKAQTLTVKENHPHDAETKKGKIRIDMERMISIAAEEKGLNYAIIRMPDFYGPFVINGLYDKLFENALKGEALTWYGALDVPMEFIYIEDAGQAMVEAGLSNKSNEKVFNVPGHSITTPREFLSEIVRQSFKNSKIKSIKSPVAFTIVGFFNSQAREFKELLYLKKERFILDGTHYKFTFGTVPATPYPLGIKKTLRWFRNFDLKKLKTLSSK